MANTKSIDLESGSSQYLSIADGSQTGLDITGDLTMECWVKFESLPSGASMDIQGKYEDTANDRSYGWRINEDGASTLQFLSTTDGSSGTQVISEVAWSPSTATWYHLAVVYDASESGGSVLFYVDGSQQGSTQTGQGGSIHSGTSDFHIGDLALGGEEFDGLIDEFRIWNDVRTQQEISDNMNTELVGDEAGLVGYWQFNDSLLDETSNDNDLTAPNGSAYDADLPDWTVDYSLVMDAGSIVLSGVAALFVYGKTLVADAGSYALTGVAAGLTSARSLVMSAGSIALSGVAATFNRGYNAVLSAGSYVLTGIDAILVSTGWDNRTKPSTSYTERSKPSTSYSDRTKPTTSWTNR